jgi:hypothetical protein
VCARLRRLEPVHYTAAMDYPLKSALDNLQREVSGWRN